MILVISPERRTSACSPRVAPCGPVSRVVRSCGSSRPAQRTRPLDATWGDPAESRFTNKRTPSAMKTEQVDTGVLAQWGAFYNPRKIS